MLTTAGDEVLSSFDGAVQDYGTMIGRVTDDVTGHPIEGFCAEVTDQYSGSATAVSDADGWFHYPEVLVEGDAWGLAFARLYDCIDLGYADESFEDNPIGAGVAMGLNARSPKAA